MDNDVARELIEAIRSLTHALDTHREYLGENSRNSEKLRDDIQGLSSDARSLASSLGQTERSVQDLDSQIRQASSQY